MGQNNNSRLIKFLGFEPSQFLIFKYFRNSSLNILTFLPLNSHLKPSSPWKVLAQFLLHIFPISLESYQCVPQKSIRFHSHFEPMEAAHWISRFPCSPYVTHAHFILSINGIFSLFNAMIIPGMLSFMRYHKRPRTWYFGLLRKGLEISLSHVVVAA